MITLALDTSTNQGGIALLRVLPDGGTALLANRSWLREKSHSELVTSTILDCLLEAKLKIENVERIAVGRGPGSFTGIRIAINAARALAYSLDVPLFAFDTNEILAAAVPSVTPTAKQTPLLTVVNAHKNLLYSALHTFEDGAWVKRDGPAAWTIEEIEKQIQVPHLCVGDGYIEFENLFPPGLKSNLLRDKTILDYPSAEALARLSLGKSVRPLVWKELQPLYIRASEAEEKLRDR